MSLLRDRMSRDMERAGLADRTRSKYIAAIAQMAGFLGRSPDQLAPDDIRAWDDELRRRGLSPGELGIQVAAQMFLYRRTLGRPEMVSFLSFSRPRRKLPIVLSMDEVFRILAAIRDPRYRIFFALLFDTGLRISEAADLKVGDIDRGCGVRLRSMRKGAAWDDTYEMHCRPGSRRRGPDSMPGGKPENVGSPILQRSGPKPWNGPGVSASTRSAVPWG